MLNKIPFDWLVNDYYPEDEQRLHLGAIPTYLNAASSDPIWLQLQENSRSGWNPVPPGAGFQFSQDDVLLYPGLPPLSPVAMATHLGERIFIYPANFVLILQLNQDYSLARVS